MKTMQYHIPRGFSMIRMFTIPVAIAALCSLALSQAQGQATNIIQNFDGFADTSALDAAISGVTPNATITLNPTNGVGGSQAVVFQGNDGASPYYTQFTLNMTPFSLSGLSAVTVQLEGSGTGSAENFKVMLIHSGTVIMTGPIITNMTKNISSNNFETYTIAFTNRSDTIDGIRFSINPGYYGQTQVTIDNVAIGGTPILSIYPNKQTTPGLMTVCGNSHDVYTRALMMALDVTNGTRNYSWVGSGATPVTYSQTIVSYPETNFFGAVSSVIYLVQNGTNDPLGVNYDASNVVELSIIGNADGTATASLQYKTNEPAGNSQFGQNTLARLDAPSPLGTWSLTFLNDTNVTVGWVPLGGGAGFSTNANFPDETTVQTYFANPLSVFMGNQQNSAAALGLSCTYSEFKISGVTISPPLDTVWSNQTVMDTTNWGKVCNAPGDILLVQPGDKYWVSWSVGDPNFVLNISTNLAAGSNSWRNAGLSQIVNMPTTSQVLLPSLATNYPVGANNVFFSLINTNEQNGPFTQLQVLWPGQTNAPDTTNGYVGSPTPVSVSGGGGVAVVNVTINACDSKWHIINTSGDSISLTSSDSSAVLPATPGTLSNGTVQEQVGFINTGSPTVTATDNTNTNIPPATSDPLTVNP